MANESASIWGDQLEEIQQSLEPSQHWLRIKDGDSRKLRLLGTLLDGNMVRGWLSFGLNSKPIYKHLRTEIVPEMLGTDPWGNAQKIWPFWCLPVFDHAAHNVKLWEIKQQTLQQRLFELTNPTSPNPQWSDWRNYDLEVKFNKSLPPAQMWQVQPYQPEALTAEVKQVVWSALQGLKMSQLFEGLDPLEQAEAVEQPPLSTPSPFE
mgnify:FL=1